MNIGEDIKKSGSTFLGFEHKKKQVKNLIIKHHLTNDQMPPPEGHFKDFSQSSKFTISPHEPNHNHWVDVATSKITGDSNCPYFAHSHFKAYDKHGLKRYVVSKSVIT